MPLGDYLNHGLHLTMDVTPTLNWLHAKTSRLKTVVNISSPSALAGCFINPLKATFLSEIVLV